jgi:2-methylcitrate dehydratase PrpD
MTDTAWPGLTEAVVERCRSVSPGSLPAGAEVFARHCLLDWFGVALAGSREPAAEIVSVVVREPSGVATLVGRAERANELTAALINGTAAHALDYDDLHPPMSAHPSAAIVAVLLAAADRDGGVSGKRLLAALAAGVEAGSVVGYALNPAHYEAGWHGTGTIGTIAAASAAMHLLGGEAHEWMAAIGLAATQAAGLKVMFGTMAKPLHAGKAASNGLLSARLALAGMTARADALEAPGGFGQLYGGAGAWPPPSGNGRLAIQDIVFKYHASCTATQATIENALAIGREHGLQPGDVERVELRVAPELETVCGIREPRDGMEAKFSLRTTTALALSGDDTSDIATFSDERISNSDVVALRDRVDVVYDAAAAGQPFWAAMRVITTQGAHLSAESEVGIELDTGLQEERLVRKFRSLAGRVLEPNGVETLMAAILGVEALDDVRTLTALARQS